MGREKGQPQLLSEERLERLALDFETSFFEQVVSRDPDNIEALIVLGQAYTGAGRHDDGLDVDLRLSELLPEDATVRYNLACSYSLCGEVDEAFDALYKAIELGYRDLRHLLKDPDLAAVRRDERFPAVVARLRRRDRRTV